jgi:hypothetical protein
LAIATVFGVIVCAAFVFAYQRYERRVWISQSMDTAEAEMRKLLKDPYSARFEEVGIVGPADDGLRPIVCGFVNSRNGFGAYAGRSQFVWANGIIVFAEDTPGALNYLWTHHDCDHRIMHQ